MIKYNSGIYDEYISLGKWAKIAKNIIKQNRGSGAVGSLTVNEPTAQWQMMRGNPLQQLSSAGIPYIQKQT